MKNGTYPLIASLVISPSPPSLFPLFLPLSYLSVVWRTPADVGLSPGGSEARAAIFFSLVSQHSLSHKQIMNLHRPR